MGLSPEVDVTEHLAAYHDVLSLYGCGVGDARDERAARTDRADRATETLKRYEHALTTCQDVPSH